jgi:hypothetical protein
MSEEEVFNLAPQYSMFPLSPPLPSSAPPPPLPPPLGAPAFSPPIPNWPWVIPDLVDLTQVPSDGEESRVRLLASHGLFYFHFFYF